jgi:hypothetical protein
MLIYQDDALRFLAIPIIPRRPEPNSQNAAGTGTAETAEIFLLNPPV